MKKLFFLLAIFLWSGILVLLSFSRDTPNQKDGVVNIDFSEWEKLYNWDTSKRTFTEMSLTGSKKWVDTLYLHRFSPADGIYYRSGDKHPFVLEKKDGANIVTFGTGLFVCNIQTGLEKYEFRLGDMTLKPKGRGVFLLDNTSGQTKVFSFDAFLDTELVSGTSRSHIAHFTLFPSLLFRHDPKNTVELKEADILRISTIDSIRYVDMKTAEDSEMLFSWENTKTDKLLLATVQKDITDRINAFVGLYNSLGKQNNAKASGVSFFDTSNALLVNGSKKEVLLKNTLVESITHALGSPLKTPYVTAIDKTISEMKEMNPKVYADGLSLLRQYYYIASFSRFDDKNSPLGLSWQESPLLFETEKIIANSTKPNQWPYYTQLSNLFSIYYFLTLKSQEFNDSFEKILQRIIDNKVLTKDEFLPFTFFVTQYLSTGPVVTPNEDTMLIISHLFQITDDYYSNNKSNGAKLATITSTTFYNYTKIFTKIHSMFLKTFTDATSDGLLLKKDYLDGENANLEQNFVDAFVRVIKTAKWGAESRKDAFYSKDSLQPDSRVTDSYTLLKATLDSFDTLVSIFTNYPQYLNDSHLNDHNKSARGILVEKETMLSREALETYLKNFNSLDISSLQVANNFQKDGFYDVQVNIMGNAFNFKLWEQNHILADISYADSSGKKHTFPNSTVPLDQKEEQFKELLSSWDNPALQYKYDFKNFFETTFLKGDSTAGTQPEAIAPIKDSWVSTPEIQLFIQKELIDKDFKNIKGFLPIEFKSIHASISEGNYVIGLDGLNKTFAWANNSYSADISSKYLFNRHSFSRVTFQVKKEGEEKTYEFNNTAIEILPARLSLLSLPDSLKDLGYYIDTIKSSYTNQQSVVIDLTGKKVLLDNVPFLPKFPTP